MVFAVNTDGTGFTNIYSFSYYTNSDGGSRITSLLLSGNTLYGTTYLAGVGGSGTIFSISLPVSSPELTITSSAANVLLTWPTNFTGFILQSATNLSSQVWTKVVPDPVVINGQNTVTNPISGTQQFFRLSR